MVLMVHIKEKKFKKIVTGRMFEQETKSFVRFEVLMAVTVKIKILWDVTPYTVVDIY